MQLAIVLPGVAAVLILLFDKHPNLRETVTLAAAAGLFAIALSLTGPVVQGERPSTILIETLPGLALALEAEPIGVLFALVASFLWLITSVYSIGYMRSHNQLHQTRFYACFALALASTMGVAFAGNMFTLFAFYEVLTLSTYPLVIHAGTPEAHRSGRVYLGILLGTSIGLQLLAIVWTWSTAGTLDFREGGILTDKLTPAAAGALLALYILGIGKAAIMPFHRWLPAAMVAPAPVSALLHAVAVVKAGAFSILKVAVYIFGLDLMSGLSVTTWLAYLAAITILIGSLVAMRQDNLKLRLAYSTVSQLSYIVLGALLANPWGIVGGGMHIAMHAFAKITLFFCAGAIVIASHKTRVSEMAGLGRQMPITMAAFLVASISIVGLPPAGGLWSKWYLGMATLEAGQLVLLAALMLSSVLSAAYLLPIPLRAFLRPSPEPETGMREGPTACVLALSLTAIACVYLFLFPNALHALAGLAVGRAPAGP